MKNLSSRLPSTKQLDEIEWAGHTAVLDMDVSDPEAFDALAAELTRRGAHVEQRRLEPAKEEATLVYELMEGRKTVCARCWLKAGMTLH